MKIQTNEIDDFVDSNEHLDKEVYEANIITDNEQYDNFTSSTEYQDRGYSQVQNDTGSLVSGIVTSCILSGLAWASYKVLWDKDERDEQKQMMWRGIVIVVVTAAAFRWYKALF